MATTDIVIRGAREHNLRDVSLDLPRGTLDLLHRRQRLGQELARLRHALCRGAAAVRREPLAATPASSSARCPSPRSTGSTGLAPRSRSSRRPAGGTRDRPSARSPRSTTTCASCSRGSARGTARSCGRPVAAQTREQIVAARSSTCPTAPRTASWPRSSAARRGNTRTSSPSSAARGYVPGAGRRPGRRALRTTWRSTGRSSTTSRSSSTGSRRARRSGRGWPRRSRRR